MWCEVRSCRSWAPRTMSMNYVVKKETQSRAWNTLNEGNSCTSLQISQADVGHCIGHIVWLVWIVYAYKYSINTLYTTHPIKQDVYFSIFISLSICLYLSFFYAFCCLVAQIPKTLVLNALLE